MGRHYKYPLHKLEIGESLLIPNPPICKNGYYTPISSTANKRLKPKRFKQIAGDKGLTVWRTE